MLHPNSPRPSLARVALAVLVIAAFASAARGEFIGVFTHTEPYADMPAKLASLERLVTSNPQISGLTLKIQWQQLHPERDRLDWDGLERLIATAAKAGLRVNLALIPGGASPAWIYEAGARKAGPFNFNRRDVFVPVPWDQAYIDLFLADLKAVAARYADDPRIWQVEVIGHHYNPGGEEMHAPRADEMKPFGWSEEVALTNWKYWIDRYAELFPAKQLSLVVSQMYKGAAPALPRQVAAYFVERCAGRAVLQTHQLQGREDALAESAQICRDLAPAAPSCHEAVGSFKEQPERQGSAAMTIYNARRAGDRLLYIQLWRRDCDNPQYAKGLLEAWEKYGALNAAEMKARLIAEGLYVEKSNWRPTTGQPR